VNWKTEKAATQMETLYERVEAECTAVDADKADPKNRNSLVLVSGKLTPGGPVENDKFNVTQQAATPSWTQTNGMIPQGGDLHIEVMTVEQAQIKAMQMPACQGFCFKGPPTKDPVQIFFKAKSDVREGKIQWTTFTKQAQSGEDCLGIRTTVSIYTKMPDDDGKGKGKGKGKGQEHKPKFEWSTFSFSDDTKSEVTPGIYTKFDTSTDLGDGFVIDLSEFMAGINANATCSWKSCSFGPEVSLKAKPSVKFTKADDNKYYSGDKNQPKENDIKVEFEQMESSSKCSVMALQVAKEGSDKDTFLPYILIPHTCPCYDADSEQEKEALYEGGKKTLEADKDLSQELKPDCWSLMSCSFCFGVMFRPEIRFINATMSCTKEQALEKMRSTTNTMKWVCRIIGYLMLFFGLKWMFDPIADVLHFIPLIGGILSGLVGLVIWVFALIMSIAIYLLIKIVAAAFYNPVRALIYTGILVCLIIVISLCGGSSSSDHSVYSGHHHHKVF
jgi:hypothetical protein